MNGPEWNYARNPTAAGTGAAARSAGLGLDNIPLPPELEFEFALVFDETEGEEVGLVECFLAARALFFAVFRLAGEGGGEGVEGIGEGVGDGVRGV